MLSAAGAKHLLLLSSLVTNACALVMLSAAGAKHLLFRILRYAGSLEKAGPSLRGLPKEKAGPSLRARAARSAQDDKPLALSKEKEEPEFQAVV